MHQTGNTVFVVDDDTSVLTALRRLIGSSGYHVVTFGSAEDFLHSASRDMPGCLVLDIRLPGMSGIELQEHLAANGIRIPIIFITAYNNVHSRTKAASPQAIAYLEKPFDGQSLLDAIQLAFKGKQGGH